LEGSENQREEGTTGALRALGGGKRFFFAQKGVKGGKTNYKARQWEQIRGLGEESEAKKKSTSWSPITEEKSS